MVNQICFPKFLGTLLLAVSNIVGMTIQLKRWAVLLVLSSSRKLYHNECIYFPSEGQTQQFQQHILQIWWPSLKKTYKGMYLYKQQLGFYMCPCLHNSSFLIYKWNQMIWDHDDLDIYSMNYSEKRA